MEAGAVHRISHGVSNFYLVEEDGKFVLVDAGVAGDRSLLARELARLGRAPADLRAILLTHAHSDHTGIAERLRTEVGIPVRVHSADAAVARGGTRPRNEGGLAGYLVHLEAWRTLFGLLAHGGMRIVPIHEVSTFEDGETLDVPGRPRVVHLPGHTAGMSVLWFERLGVVCTGDALVTRNPLTGRRGPQIMPRGLNQDSRRALESLERLEGLPARALLPGHGDPWTGGAAEAVRTARAQGIT